MADPVNGGNSSGQPPKELSMEVRLLLAFLLMGAVMFIFNYVPYFKSTPPPATNPPEAAAGTPGGQPAQPGKPPEAAPQPAAAEAAPPAGTASASATPQESLPNLTLETDVYRISFSNQGGTVRSWL